MTEIKNYQALQIRSNSLLSREPELKAKFLNGNNLDFYRFIDTEGVLYYREIQEVSVPFPPSSEMITVGGETDLRKFLSIGISCFDAITSKIAMLSKGVDDKLKILDFGIGCARTARHFYRYQDQYDIYGCDVDHAAISYLKKFVPFIDSSVSPNLPPLNYPISFFDYIYSVSVFSHLNEIAYSLWIEELLRRTKEGGCILFSVHGNHALEILLKNDNPEYISINRDSFYTRIQDFKISGFMWVPQWVGSNDIDSSQYGISFLSDEKIRELVPKGCKLVEHIPGYFQNWQDLILIQKIKN